VDSRFTNQRDENEPQHVSEYSVLNSAESVPSDNTIALPGIDVNGNLTFDPETKQVPAYVPSSSVRSHHFNPSELTTYQAIPTENEHHNGTFAPYESPLRMFKAYRFHPDYPSNIPGGYRSLTYSHQIDANKPLCQYEAAGGICNDNECQDQHFRSMGLTG